MKKILFFLSFAFAFAFADSASDCLICSSDFKETSRSDTHTENVINANVNRNSVACTISPLIFIGNFSHYSVLHETISSTSWYEGKSQTLIETDSITIECTKCVKPDEPLPPIDSSVWKVSSTVPSQNGCSSSDTRDILGECSAMGGTVYSEIRDCCSISHCFIPVDSNETAPPDDNSTNPCVDDFWDELTDCDCPVGTGIPNNFIGSCWSASLNDYYSCGSCRPVDENGTDPTSDPCYYPPELNGYPFRITLNSENTCSQVSGREYAVESTPFCEFYKFACYYGVPPLDDNGTSPEDNSTNPGGGDDNNTSPEDNSTNPGDGGGDGNGTTPGDGNGTIPSDGNGTSDSNGTGIAFDGDKVSDVKSKISALEGDIEKSTELFSKVKTEFTTFFANIESSYAGLINTYENYQTIFDEKPVVSLPAGNFCPGLSLSIFGTNIDLGKSMCSALQMLSPIVSFILFVVTQLSLIYISLLLLRKD